MTDSAKRIALVTGANKGIGLEIARQLGHAGVRVLVGARDDAKGAAAVAQLTAEGLDAQAVRIDVADDASVAAAAIAADHGRLDILVNNAGISPSKTARRARRRWRDPPYLRHQFLRAAGGYPRDSALIAMTHS